MNLLKADTGTSGVNLSRKLGLGILIWEYAGLNVLLWLTAIYNKNPQESVASVTRAATQPQASLSKASCYAPCAFPYLSDTSDNYPTNPTNLNSFILLPVQFHYFQFNFNLAKFSDIYFQSVVILVSTWLHHFWPCHTRVHQDQIRLLVTWEVFHHSPCFIHLLLLFHCQFPCSILFASVVHLEY